MRGKKETQQKTIDCYFSQQTIKAQRYHYVTAKVKGQEKVKRGKTNKSKRANRGKLHLEGDSVEEYAKIKAFIPIFIFN